MYDNISHIGLFLVASLFVEGLAVYAWRFRSIPGAVPYTFHKAAISLLLLSLIMCSVSTGVTTKIIWIRLNYSSIFIAVLAWVGVTLQMTGHNKWINRRTITMVLMVLTFALLVLFSNEQYGLFWKHIWAEGDNIRTVDGFFGDLILWIGYLILFACTSLFFLRFIKIKGILRTQAGIIIVSTGITVSGYFCWKFMALPGLRQDILAIAFIISGLMDSYAFFRLRMFDIMSVAQAAVTETMGDGLIVLDKYGLIVGLNPAAAQLITGFNTGIRGDLAVDLFKFWPEIIGQIRNDSASSCEVYIEPNYYTVFSVPLSLREYQNLGKALVFHNISVEKEAQKLIIEQQRAMAVLKERDRLGRELHDGKGQLLGYFNMQLEAARSLIVKNRPDQAEPLLKKLAGLTQDLHTDIRESITGLKNVPSEEGFLQTVDDYLRWFGQSYGIRTDFVVNCNFNEGMLSRTAEVQLQRIIQEALTNIRKHAGAKQVQIIIHAEENRVEIIIEDDGSGFDVTEARAKKGSYGLRIMWERAEEIGADLSFISKPRAGTVLRIRIPAKSRF